MEATSKKVWTLDELNKLKEKYHWMIINRNVYNLKSWAKIHPGGDLIIGHFLYKDATSEFNSQHPEYVRKEILPRYFIGTLHPDEKTIMDTELSKSFIQLEKRLRERNLFSLTPGFYILEILKCICIFTVCLWLLINFAKQNDSYLTYSFAGLVMGAFWHQLAFVGHDLGHNEISHKMSIDHLLGIFVGTFCGGISIGWWKDTHNVHHVVTNDPEHDPDIQHLPFLAVSPKFFKNLFSTYHKRILKFDGAAKYLVGLQNYLYYVIMMFGRFNLYAQSILFLCFNKRARYVGLELFAYVLFALWYGYLVSLIPTIGKKLIFIVISHALTFLLHVQITISHFAMCTEKRKDDEEFCKHELRTTMDVDCDPWMDWLHGGLQFQAVHHLFPRMPRCHLREASYEVIKFCQENGLDYKSYSFYNGNVKVINHLKDVSNMIKY
jgi:delta8-fatty-acid desaturase